MFLFIIFFSQCQCLTWKLLCSEVPVNYVSSSPLFVLLATQGLYGEGRKKKEKEAHRKAPHVNSPDPRRRFFNPARALRRVTNCERPRCDRWISGLPGRPPRPSRNSRPTANFLERPQNRRNNNRPVQLAH